THAARRWIVYHSPQYDAMIVLGGGNAAAPTFWRKESHVLHTQRLGEVALLVLVEGEARELLHQRAQHNEVDIAVAELHPRGGDRGGGKGAAQSFCFALPC